MSRSDLDRVMDAIRHSEQALAVRDRVGERIVRQAILYDLIAIGTTFAVLTDTTKNLAPGIPWNAVIRTRNRLVHAYWSESQDFLANVLDRDLPTLIDQLRDLLDIVRRT